MGHLLWSKHTRIFVDTSSLMEKSSAIFMRDHLVPALRGKDIHPLIVMKSVVDELNKKAIDGDESTSRKARKAKKVVKNLFDKSDAVIDDKDNEGFADHSLLTKFTSVRLKYRLILITQDWNLAKEILSLNNSEAVDRIHGIDAFRVGDRGHPMRWKLDSSHHLGVRPLKLNPADGFLSTTHDSSSMAHSQSRSSIKHHTRAHLGESDLSRSPKVRVYQVAKEKGISSDVLIAMLKGMGWAVKSHMNVVTPEMLDALNDRESRPRVYQVAKERKMSSDVLITMLKSMGWAVKSHMSVVTPEMLDALNDRESRPRVYQVAKERKMSSDALIAMLKSMGMEVQNHKSAVTPPMLNALNDRELSPRVYQVAKEKGMSNDALIAMLKGMGWVVKGHMGVVTPKMLEALNRIQ